MGANGERETPKGACIGMNAAIACLKCGSLDIDRVPMTPDEARFGMDMWHCRTCGCYQNRAGEEVG